MDLRIAKIIPTSLVDGPGVRTVIFFQGCTLACKFCQNKHLWPASGGYLTNVQDLAETVTLLGGQRRSYTITGGEPFQQPAALAELVWRLRKLGAMHIIVYTGYTWDELFSVTHPARPYLKEILERVDVVVDGRFVAGLDSPFIIYRGSRNQRPIDVAASLDAGVVISLRWDTPEIVIDPAGNVTLPIGLALELADLGTVENSRMCGQTK